MEKEKTIIKQLLIKLDHESYKQIKIRAMERNITLKKWILQAVAEKIMREDKFK